VGIRVEPLYNIEDMWKTARRMARQTVNKATLDKPVSQKFKCDLIVSEHSPLREIRFIIQLIGIPVWVGQQFSRHRIATNRSDFSLTENVNPTDIEHYVQTQRTDRTGNPRDSNALIDYTFTANAQGLIDMSKKRLCRCASAETRNTWRKVVDELVEIEPLLSFALVPSCIYRGFCPETMSDCDWINGKEGIKTLGEYRDFWWA